MRTAFVSTLLTLAHDDERVMLLTGDLGFTVVEPFAQSFADRFVNVGVAEQNMLGLATGLAQQGFIPYCYSIATFAAMRGYEQLRDGGVLHDHAVRIVGVGGGFGYGSAGATHWGLEDLGLMRLQPGLTVVAPGSDAQVCSAVRAIHETPGPVYLRLAKDRAGAPQLGASFAIGRLETLQSGATFALITTGGMTGETMRAAKLLERRGLEPTVVQVPCIAPAPMSALAAVAAEHPVLVTVEDHYRTGGLGSLVAEAVADAGVASRVIRLGVDRIEDGLCGDEAWMRSRHGLTADGIAEVAAAALQRRSAA